MGRRPTVLMVRGSHSFILHPGLPEANHGDLLVSSHREIGGKRRSLWLLLRRDSKVGRLVADEELIVLTDTEFMEFGRIHVRGEAI